MLARVLERVLEGNSRNILVEIFGSILGIYPRKIFGRIDWSNFCEDSERLHGGFSERLQKGFKKKNC